MTYLLVYILGVASPFAAVFIYEYFFGDLDIPEDSYYDYIQDQRRLYKAEKGDKP